MYCNFFKSLLSVNMALKYMSTNMLAEAILFGMIPQICGISHRSSKIPGLSQRQAEEEF